MSYRRGKDIGLDSRKFTAWYEAEHDTDRSFFWSFSKSVKRDTVQKTHEFRGPY